MAFSSIFDKVGRLSKATYYTMHTELFCCTYVVFANKKIPKMRYMDIICILYIYDQNLQMIYSSKLGISCNKNSLFIFL